MTVQRRIQKRRILVWLVTTSQLLSMLLALWWFSSRMDGHLTEVIRDQIKTNNQQIMSRLDGRVDPDRLAQAVPDVDSYGVGEAVSRAISQMHGFLIIATIVAAYVGAVSALAILRRYDNRLLRKNDQLELMVERRSQSHIRARDAIIFGLAKLAEWRDDSTGSHLDRIRSYVISVAAQLGKSDPELDEEAVHMLGLTSSLHDIGKVGIPDSVLLKQGPLTPEEREVIEEHPLIGGNCLMAIKERLGQGDEFLRVACEIALSHHERWDGKGYPYGLQAEQIPRAARIVALADVYDALTSKRCYKDAFSHEEARKIIIEGSGSHFDPQVVQAFLECEHEFRAISLASREADRTSERAQDGDWARTITERVPQEILGAPEFEQTR